MGVCVGVLHAVVTGVLFSTSMIDAGATLFTPFLPPPLQVIPPPSLRVWLYGGHEAADQDVTVLDNKSGTTALQGSIETGNFHFLVMKVCVGV